MDPEYITGMTLRINDVIARRSIPVRGWIPAFCGLALVVFSALILGCREIPQLTKQEMEGKHLYQGRCAHCHEDNDLALKKVPPDLHGTFARAKLPSGAPATDAEVRRVVLAGKGMMPAFAGRFNEAQMSALLSYLHTGLL